jgi:hypothetical protein
MHHIDNCVILRAIDSSRATGNSVSRVSNQSLETASVSAIRNQEILNVGGEDSVRNV